MLSISPMGRKRIDLLPVRRTVVHTCYSSDPTLLGRMARPCSHPEGCGLTGHAARTRRQAPGQLAWIFRVSVRGTMDSGS